MEVAPASFKERRANLDTFLIPSFSLDSGATLENVEIGYRTYGRAQSDNAIYICHSLSADCHITDYGNGSGRGWWSKQLTQTVSLLFAPISLEVASAAQGLRARTLKLASHTAQLFLWLQ